MIKNKKKRFISIRTSAPALNREIMFFWVFAHIVGMGWVLVKQCNNGEEAVTEGFPWEFMKPEEKVYTNNVLSSHMGT